MLNKITLAGRLTKEPEFRETERYKLCRFTIACDRDYQQNGEDRVADFINCTAFGNTATFIDNKFTKGDMIIVSGRLQIDIDRTDSHKSYTSVVIDNAYFCGSKKKEEKKTFKKETDSQTRFRELNRANAEDDIPF